MHSTPRPTMDATAANGAIAAHNQDASPNGTSKLSHHSPGEEDHEVWSGGEDESGDDTGRQSGSKRKREKLSVSCETCKQRKVKCDRGHPACESTTLSLLNDLDADLDYVLTSTL